MISFYPGPSKVYPQVRQYLLDAYDEDILSINHRGEKFMFIYENCIKFLKEKLDIPSNYAIYFTSSATECWEIIAQSFIEKNSTHLFNGSFGEKWFNYTNRIKADAISIPFDIENELPIDITIKPTEILCVTQNETSNGTQVSNVIIKELKEKYPSSLLAIDITSSIGGVKLPIDKGDIWFGSVQKCLGLPAGLGLMICSPQAMERAKKINDHRFYNSILFIDENMQKWQTHYTPNVLGIYLLMRAMENVAPISDIDKLLKARSTKWQTYLSSLKTIQPLIANKETLSSTVWTIKSDEKIIHSIKDHAHKNGIILGNGYGNWKSNTFRIANFPAIEESEFNVLEKFLTSYCM